MLFVAAPIVCVGVWGGGDSVWSWCCDLVLFVISKSCTCFTLVVFLLWCVCVFVFWCPVLTTAESRVEIWPVKYIQAPWWPQLLSKTAVLLLLILCLLLLPLCV